MNVDEIKTKYCIDDPLDPQAVAELKKRAPGLLKMLNSELKRKNSQAHFEMPSNAVSFSDGFFIRLKLAGKIDDNIGAVLRSLDGLRRLGVIFKANEHKIFLEKSWRPTSHRGVVVNPFMKK